ncbi:hypothetical protein BTVI_58960 [Pitangus sulphuratus]|nr:hypothetical protein BTVI_58960 [Pitangus sulphuratus]
MARDRPRWARDTPELLPVPSPNPSASCCRRLSSHHAVVSAGSAPARRCRFCVEEVKIGHGISTWSGQCRAEGSSLPLDRLAALAWGTAQSITLPSQKRDQFEIHIGVHTYGGGERDKDMSRSIIRQFCGVPQNYCWTIRPRMF